MGPSIIQFQLKQLSDLVAFRQNVMALLPILYFLFTAYGIISLPQILVESLYEPRSEKTGLRGFRPGPTQTWLYSH